MTISTDRRAAIARHPAGKSPLRLARRAHRAVWSTFDLGDWSALDPYTGAVVRGIAGTVKLTAP